MFTTNASQTNITHWKKKKEWIGPCCFALKKRREEIKTKVGRNLLKNDDKPKSRALQAFRPKSTPPTIICRDISQVSFIQCVHLLYFIHLL